MTPRDSQEDQGGRDAFGNPIPAGGAQHEPAPSDSSDAPGFGPGGGFAAPAAPPPSPPAGAPPGPPAAAQSPPPLPPPVTTLPPPAPPVGGYAPPAGYPPVPGYAPGVAPGTFQGHTLASWGSRVVATLLDSIFMLLALVPMGIALAASLEATAIVLFVLALVWIYFVYAPLFMMRGGERNGQTPGKQIVGIRVVRADAQQIAYGFALLRELAVKGLLFGMVGGFLFYIPTLVDYLWPLWDEQNRAVHDMVVSTRVVQA